MEENAKIVSKILKELASNCKVGTTGLELEAIASRMIKEAGAESYNKGYQPKWSPVPFPATLCISPNGVLAHGIPNKYKFKEGDIVTIDLGIKKNGLTGDAAITVAIGQLDNQTSRLLYYANKIIYALIKQIKAGVNTEYLAQFTETWAGKRGYFTNRKYAGHTIGKEMHMKPSIYNSAEDVHTYADLTEGQYICIEILLSKSKDRLGYTLSDGWSVVTSDGKKAAMFEHMLKVTKDGCVVLTDHFQEA